MGKILIIAEKPSVAKDIALALGGFGRVDNWLESPDAIISSAQGHLVEVFSTLMDTSGKDLQSLPVIPPSFDLRVIDGANRPQLFAQLKRLMSRQDVDAVVNACDAGREGELIFRLIYKLAGCTKPMKRMWFRSMTPEAIRESFHSMKPGADFDGLSDAAFCRTEGDYLVGINGSRGVTRLYERQTASVENRSVGRVQTPTGALVYDREMAIRTFRAKDYWEVHGHFGVAAGNYVGKWFDPNFKASGEQQEPGDAGGNGKSDETANRFFEKDRADAIVAKCSGTNPTDVREESKPTAKGSPRLYDLTSLQREANRKLGLSSKRTLDIAQALYEKHKVTTYPRTDSSFLPEDYVAKAQSTIESLVGTTYEPHAKRVVDGGWVKPDKKIFDNGKISDHFAIIPTGKRPEGLTPEEGKVYDMIVRRFLAVFHPAAQYQVTTRITFVAGEHFKSSGRVLISEGWMAVYGADVDDEDKKTPALVKYEAGEAVTTVRIELKTLKTKPPLRYTEDTLLAAMESAGKFVDDDELADAMKERGLGTPATRAAIIEGLLADKDGKGNPKEPYLKRDGKSLVPTPKLISLIEFLRNNGIELLASPKLTGEWEHKLRLIERGEYRRDAFNNEIGDLTRQIIDAIRKKAAEVVVKKLDAKCPQCGGEIAIGARTFDCESACGFRLWKEIAGRQLKPSEANTLLTTRVVMNLNNFISNSKKKFTACLRLNDEHKVEFFFDETVNTTDASGNPVHCPVCEKLMRRISGANGHFWSCTDRENCKTTLDDSAGNPVPKVAAQPCPKCSSDMNRVRGKKGYFWSCTDREGCKNTMDDKDGAPVTRPDPIACPDCGAQMFRRERRDKKGYFWGCSAFKKDGGGCGCILQDDNGKPVMKAGASATGATSEGAFL
ncbi:DNA topoisomerase III (plasmid) [Burkholderia sp. SFA1]|nr:DNA topoisomerase [Burkholderia sp. YI23]BBQ03062.1 DNA topoisomerase III [Burkholderia sp. SFA1]